MVKTNNNKNTERDTRAERDLIEIAYTLSQFFVFTAFFIQKPLPTYEAQML